MTEATDPSQYGPELTKIAKGETPELEAMARAMVNSTLDGADVWATMRPVSKAWFYDMARAALRALREPSPAMLQPACAKHTPGQSMGVNHFTKVDHGEECPNFRARRRIWASMIDAILSEET